MQVTVGQSRLRGVYCRFCGKPVRLSDSLLKRETAIKQKEQSPNEELRSRVFPARCRSCHEEAMYTLSQMLDLPDEEI